MPELPEVESTARFLHERVAGDTIQSARVLWNRTIERPSKEKFCRVLTGALIEQVVRNGKYVVFQLRTSEGAWQLFAHMRMSGSFDVLNSEHALEKHDRVILALGNGRDVRFHDPRKFGRFILTDTPDIVRKKIGVEPLSAEFTPARLEEIVRRRAGAIKPLLLNQAIVAGLGNIYVDEALWGARIHPLRSANRLKLSEVELLHQTIQTVLNEAIEASGTDFGDGVVYGGGFAPRVYGREGEACVKCDTQIRRLVVGQRGTHICPNCQPRRK